jgi:hypothetical protein
MKIINPSAEPTCAKDHVDQPAVTEDVVPGANGTLQNAIAYLHGDFNQYIFTPPAIAVTIDQKGCQYHPHALALITNQPLQDVNSDPVTHNIHPVPKDNREWNQSQPPGAAPIAQTFARPEVAITVKCNVHPWMKAYTLAGMSIATLRLTLRLALRPCSDWQIVVSAVGGAYDPPRRNPN